MTDQIGILVTPRLDFLRFKAILSIKAICFGEHVKIIIRL
jgi:hypothetical protein